MDITHTGKHYFPRNRNFWLLYRKGIPKSPTILTTVKYMSLIYRTGVANSLPADYKFLPSFCKHIQQLDWVVGFYTVNLTYNFKDSIKTLHI